MGIEGFLIAVLIGLGIAGWFIVKVLSGTWRKLTGVFRGSSRKAGHSKFLWVLLRLTGFMVGLALWAASKTLRPLLAALALWVLFRAVRRIQRFLGASGGFRDAFLFKELQAAMERTWATFTETIYDDPRGFEHYPSTTNWHWVRDHDDEVFGLQADLTASEGSSLGRIDDLTAQPGDKDERLAATLNRHLEKSKTFYAALCHAKVQQELHFAAIDVQTTLERLQASPDDETDIRSGHGTITLLRTDPLWKRLDIPLPLYHERWARVALPFPVILGRDRWGQEITAMISRWSIMAKSGWGKSVLLDTILMNLCLLPADRVIVIVIDCKWGLHHAKWEPGIDWLVVTPEGATECLRAVHDQMEGRAALMKAQGLEWLPEATPALPAIVVVGDETQELPAAKNGGPDLAMDYWTKIFQRGRALGIYAVNATQYATAKDLPRNISINVDLAMAGRLKDQSASGVAMGSVASKNFGPHMIPDITRNKGVFAMANQETGFGFYMRVYYTSPADKLLMVQWVLANNPRRHWDWIPEHDTAEESVVVTPGQAAAIGRLCKALNQNPDEIVLQDLPSMLKKAQKRMTPVKFQETTEQLQELLAA
jgi:hypothetical protein